MSIETDIKKLKFILEHNAWIIRKGIWSIKSYYERK